MLKQPLPGTARLLLGAALAMLASSAAAATLWQALPVNTVVLPVVSPMRAPPPLPPLERLTAVPFFPALAVSLGALPEVAAPNASPAAPAPPAAAPAPAFAPTPTPAPLATEDFQPPRVTQIWVADRPARTRFHQRDADISDASDMVVQLDVGADGKPANPQVVQSTLDRRHQESALRAVRRWQFEPARRGGVAVATTILVPVPFEPAMGPGPLRSDPSVRQAISYSQPPATRGPVTVTRGL